MLVLLIKLYVLMLVSNSIQNSFTLQLKLRFLTIQAEYIVNDYSLTYFQTVIVSVTHESIITMSHKLMMERTLSDTSALSGCICDVIKHSQSDYIISYSQTFSLQSINLVPSPSVPPIFVTITGSTTTPTVGESYTLTCTLSGVEDTLRRSTYQWRKNGAIINSHVEETLSFSFLTLSDAGQYSCTVTVNATIMYSTTKDLSLQGRLIGGRVFTVDNVEMC